MDEFGVEIKSKDGNGFHVSLLGLFFLMSFSTLLGLFFDGNAAISNQMVTATTTATKALVFLLVALFSRRIETLIDKGLLLRIAVVVMVLGTALLILAWYLPDIVVIQSLSLPALYCMNASYAVLYLAWLELYSKLEMRSVLLYFSLVNLFSSILSFTLAQMALYAVRPMILAILPIISVLLLQRGKAKIQLSGRLQDDNESSSWSIPLRPIFLLIAFGFSNTFIRLFLTTQDKTVVLFGVCIAASSVLILLFVQFKKFELKLLYVVSIPLLVAGAMCAIIGISSIEFLGAFLSNAAFVFFLIFITVLFCSISYRYGVSALWLFGFAHAGLSFGSMAAKLFGYGLRETFSLHSNLTIALSVLTVVFVLLSMNLISDKDFTTTWGITRQKPLEHESLDTQEKLLKTCSLISQRYSLTRREEEILVLLLQGVTLTGIGEKLFIAESTMKTHSRNIYKKLSVANRKELQSFIESYYND